MAIIKTTGGSGHGDVVVPTRALITADANTTDRLALTGAFRAIGHVIGYDHSGASVGRIRISFTNEATAALDSDNSMSITIHSGQSLDFSELGGLPITSTNGDEITVTHMEIDSSTNNGKAVIELWA